MIAWGARPLRFASAETLAFSASGIFSVVVEVLATVLPE